MSCRDEITSNGTAIAEAHIRRRPLWLTRDEADLLLSYSVTSPIDGGHVEGSLLGRVASFVLAFTNVPVTEID